MRIFSLALLCLVISGCEPEKPTVKLVIAPLEIQGKWKLVEVTDPSGNGFAANDIEMIVDGDKATSEGQTLRVEFAADNSYARLYATNDGVEKQVGEIVIEITTEANPVQMIWMDRVNTKQVSLFQKEP